MTGGEALKKCLSWRNEIKRKAVGVSFLDPFSGVDLDSISDDGSKEEGVTPNSITYRDYASVEAASLLVINLDTFGENRPLIGSIAEAGWAWMLRKPIIFYAPKDMAGREYYVEHPFILTFAAKITDSIEETVKAINYFVKKDF